MLVTWRCHAGSSNDPCGTEARGRAPLAKDQRRQDLIATSLNTSNNKIICVTKKEAYEDTKYQIPIILEEVLMMGSSAHAIHLSPNPIVIKDMKYNMIYK